MTLSLGKIKSTKSNKQRKRIGRGNASGSGTYCGKGQKGQKCRSGVSNLKRLGMKQVLLRTPKKRGFTSLQDKKQVVNLSLLNNYFKDGEEVTPQSLLEKKLISKIKPGVKVLGKGTLTVKKLKFKDILISDSALTQIEKLDGKVTKVVSLKGKKKTKKK